MQSAPFHKVHKDGRNHILVPTTYDSASRPSGSGCYVDEKDLLTFFVKCMQRIREEIKGFHKTNCITKKYFK